MDRHTHLPILGQKMMFLIKIILESFIYYNSKCLFALQIFKFKMCYCFALLQRRICAILGKNSILVPKVCYSVVKTWYPLPKMCQPVPKMCWPVPEMHYRMPKMCFSQYATWRKFVLLAHGSLSVFSAECRKSFI